MAMMVLRLDDMVPPVKNGEHQFAFLLKVVRVKNNVIGIILKTT